MSGRQAGSRRETPTGREIGINPSGFQKKLSQTKNEILKSLCWTCFSNKFRNIAAQAAKGGLTVLISVLIIFTIVKAAGSLTPLASPAATSYTLGDIYARLTTNATSTAGDHIFAPSGSPAGTLYSLTEIYNKIPTINPSKLLSDTTYLGVTGSVATQTLSAANEIVNAGYYNATTLSVIDSDLITSNILSGKTIFGVDGTVDPSPDFGDDNPTQVLNTASNPGTYNATNLSAENVRNAIAFGVGQTGTFTGNLAFGDDNAANVLTVASTPGTYNVSNLSNSVIKSGTTWGVSLGSTGTLTPDGGTAGVADLFNGKTAHLTNDWNLDAGTLDLACNTAAFDGNANKVADAYDGAGSGADRWCIKETGDAATGDILSAKKAWVDGLEITGSIANCSSEGSQSCYAAGTYFAGTEKTPSNSATSQSAGYYPAFDLAAVDTDLVAGNIGAYIDIFGISGTLLKNLFTGTSRSDCLSTVTLNTGGSGYTSGSQVLTITQSGASGGSVNVTVDAGGVVTSVNSIATTGKGYSVANGLATTGGGGTGATVNITAVASHYSIDVGGVDDYNDNGTTPADSYTGTWTTCDGTVYDAVTNPGGNYCNTGDTTNANKKDNSTGLVWSILKGTSTWFSANNCKYSNLLLGDDGTCNTHGEIACKCVKLTGLAGNGAKTGCESFGDGGWRLPSQKELMQAYIDGSWGNLSLAGYGYWSATTKSTYTDYAWYTDLTNGYTYNRTKTTTTVSVRCVR